MTVRWKSILRGGALVLFGMGLGGGLTTLLVVHRLRSLPPPGVERVTEIGERFLTRRLDLTPAQVEAVHPILVEFTEDLGVLRRSLAPELRAVVESTLSQMSPHLTLTQEAELESLIERWRTRWKLSPGSVQEETEMPPDS